MSAKPNINESYSPPLGSTVLLNQDKISALRLLIAQRKLYSSSKRWLGLRLIGMGLIGIAAPVITLLWQDAAVIIGAVAGTWIFLGRTAFIILERRISAKAAAVQELFDLEVFEMPSLGERSPMPTLEEITNLAGSDKEIARTAKQEKLLGWYSVNPADGGLTSVAICQRTNAAYSGGLLKVTSKIWMTITVLWVILLIILSALMNFSLSTFLLGVFLPLLPAFLDTFEYWKGIRRASIDRDNLSQEIQTKIEDDSVVDEDLLIWQTRMYDLRRDAPQVPDFIYGLMRSQNERTMHSVAKQLSKTAKRK